jgi:hypothetical protein
MSKCPMRGHFRHLRFKTFPMTPRTPQCEVFLVLLSSSEHSGVPEDSKSPTFPSVGLHPHTWPSQGCDTFGAGTTTGNTDTQDSPRPGLGGSHHLPHYSILCATFRGLHPNGSFSRDSRDSRPGVPKSRPAGLPGLWSPITLRADLGSKCGLKQSCSSRRELSNGMSHVV